MSNNTRPFRFFRHNSGRTLLATTAYAALITALVGAVGAEAADGADGTPASEATLIDTDALLIVVSQTPIGGSGAVGTAGLDTGGAPATLTGETVEGGNGGDGGSASASATITAGSLENLVTQNAIAGGGASGSTGVDTAGGTATLNSTIVRGGDGGVGGSASAYSEISGGTLANVVTQTAVAASGGTGGTAVVTAGGQAVLRATTVEGGDGGDGGDAEATFIVSGSALANSGSEAGDIPLPVTVVAGNGFFGGIGLDTGGASADLDDASLTGGAGGNGGQALSLLDISGASLGNLATQTVVAGNGGAGAIALATAGGSATLVGSSAVGGDGGNGGATATTAVVSQTSSSNAFTQTLVSGAAGAGGSGMETLGGAVSLSSATVRGGGGGDGGAASALLEVSADTLTDAIIQTVVAGDGAAGGVGLDTAGGSILLVSSSIGGGDGGAGAEASARATITGDTLGNTVTQTVVAGDGGNGGDGIATTGGTVTLRSSVVRGGQGGSGAAAEAVSDISGTSLGNAVTQTPVGGDGGAGGDGIDAENATILVDAESGVFGGDGGGTVDGTAGAGGVGVTGSALNVIVAGSVAGGVGGDGVRADAIRFTSASRLELAPGYDILGLVEASPDAGDRLVFGGASGSDTFDLTLVDADGTPDGDDQYRGFEEFAKIGGSTFTLYGENTEITALPVLGGSLYVGQPGLPAASLPNAFLAVFDGARLGGSGTVGSFEVAAGGRLAPGNTGADAIGTLTTTGDAVFDDGAIFEVDLDSAGPVDRVEVGGTATIAGGGTGGTIAVNALVGADGAATRYRIINAPGGVDGQFAAVTDNLPDVDFTDFYDGTSVELGLVPGTAGSGGFSSKENGLAAALGSGDAALLFAESLVKRLEVGGRATGLAMGTAPLGYAEDGNGLSAAHNADMVEPLPVAEVGGVSVFLGAMGQHRESDDEAFAPGYDAGIGGVLGGVDYAMAAGGGTARIGIAAGYSRTDVDVANGSAEIDAGHLGLYGSYGNGPLQLAGALAYQWTSTDLERFLGTPGAGRASAGGVDGHAFSGFGEAFYDLGPMLGANLGMDRLSLGPVARLRGFSATRDGYTESGVGFLNLSVDEDTADHVFGDIGMRIGGTVTRGETVFTPQLELRYERDFSGDGDASFASLGAVGGSGFLTPVSYGGRDRFGVGLNLGVAFSQNFSGQIRYDGSFGDGVQSHAGSANLSYRF